ncbi:anti-ECFsigma factor ChrR [Hyphomonas adhaerens MHS-3]|uniref:Anti-ECFsigma factor ChrR n=1 Tax=Hyphomonas adhaerens MHS-3 TaxID=1280949 RepID=A0A069E4X8_9PROT|nr:cupin domain-containing protein [Hyphomonas adhaerens]KCZ82603.1 anti-ECFsigma factor ChrR [Hyphomonas adhaerens MHS-3]
MNSANSLPVTVDDDWLAMQSAGSLSPFKQLLLTCQADINPRLRDAITSNDHVAGAMLESAKPAALSDDFLTRLNTRLDADLPVQSEANGETRDEDGRPEWMPAPLADYIRRSGSRLKWRSAGLGVQRARLGRNRRGERLYLLRAKPGLPVPRHSHSGQEWTLVLAGGYKSGSQQFVAGDLHQEDEGCMHDLRIDDDGPCISLIVDEGKLKFANPLLKLFQPVLGI